MLNNTRKYGFWWVLLLGSILIAVFYYRYITNPNGYLLSTTNEGLNNYHSFNWAVDHDSTFYYSNATNFPFGEHPTYANSQPLISSVARFINYNISYIGNVTIGLNNLLLFASILLGIMYLYKILFELTHNVFTSIGGALVLGLLSPQIHSFSGNFQLGYCFIFPMFFWWLYLFFRNPSIRLSRYMAMGLFFVLLINPSFLIPIVILVLSIWLFFLIFDSPRINIFIALAYLFIQLALPIGLFYLGLYFTDTISDRFIVDATASTHTWKILFRPSSYSSILNIGSNPSSNIAYIGIPAIIFIAWGLFNGSRQLLVKRFRKTYAKNYDIPYNQRFMVNTLWAMGFVFLIVAVVPTLGGLGFFKNLKLLRFDTNSLIQVLWVVFYGLNICILWYVHRKTKNKINQSWLPLILLAVFAIEATFYNIRQAQVMDNEKPIAVALPNKVTAKNYSSIVSLPAINETFEDIGGLNHSQQVWLNSLSLSMQTGIPIQGITHKEASLKQSKLQMETGFVYTQIPKLMKGVKKPFLLLLPKGDSTSLGDLSKIQPVAKTDKYTLYRFSPKVLEVLLLKQAAALKKQADTTEQLPHLFFKYNSDDSTFAFKGKGALKINAAKVLVDSTCGFCKGQLAVSFWLKGDLVNTQNTDLKVNSTLFPSLNRYIKAINGDWLLIEVLMKKPSSKLKITIQPKHNATLFIDNVLVRNANETILKIDEDYIAKNNYYYLFK
jgi:hypothetical protein